MLAYFPSLLARNLQRNHLPSGKLLPSILPSILLKPYPRIPPASLHQPFRNASIRYLLHAPSAICSPVKTITPPALGCTRFTSTSSHHPSPLPPNFALSPPIVSKHLILVAGLIFTIVIVGGYTRLTESGLSITEWNLVSGILPPLNVAQWQVEFEKYQSTPEFKLLNHSIGLEEFKHIFFWEWYHRLMGRLIGLSFLLPVPFFIKFGLIQSNKIRWSLLGIGGLIGSQGALGWYMVRSGLDQEQLDQRDGIPRVSQYRLAAHLLLAFTVYSACVRLSGAIWRDWKLAVEQRPLFNRPVLRPIDSILFLNQRIPNRARFLIHSLTALVFVTAGSGAFVAGLDAGLVYNTFPKMGGRWIPDREELVSDVYTNRGSRPKPINPESSSSPAGLVDLRWMKNLFENPTTVQFNHRILGIVTFLSSLSYVAFIEKHKSKVPKSTIRLTRFIGLTALNQVGLGIATLVYLVPTSLALLHQTNSLLLLSLTLFTGLSLRRPGSLALKSFHKNSQFLLQKSK